MEITTSEYLLGVLTLEHEYYILWHLGNACFCVPIFVIIAGILFFFNTFIYLFIYLWLHRVFMAVCGLSLVSVSGRYSSLRCTGFSLCWLLLLWSMDSKCTGFSSCGTQAQ